MRTTRAMVALAAGLALAGCAPVVYSPGAGVGLSTGPGMGVSASNCTLAGGSPLAAQVGIRSAAVQMSSIRNRIAQIQSSFGLSARAASSQPSSSWKRLATGECY